MPKLPKRARAATKTAVPDSAQQIKDAATRHAALVRTRSVQTKPGGKCGLSDATTGASRTVQEELLRCSESAIEDEAQASPTILVSSTKRRRPNRSCPFRDVVQTLESYVFESPQYEELLQDALRDGATLVYDVESKRMALPQTKLARSINCQELWGAMLKGLWLDNKEKDAYPLYNLDLNSDFIGSGTFAVVLAFHTLCDTHVRYLAPLTGSHRSIAVRLPRPGVSQHLTARKCVKEVQLTLFCAHNGLGPKVDAVHFERAKDESGSLAFYPIVAQQLADQSWMSALRKNKTAFQGGEAAMQTLRLLARACKADLLLADIKPNNMLCIDGEVRLCDFDPLFCVSHTNAAGSARGRLLASALLVCAHVRNDDRIGRSVLLGWQERFEAVIDRLMQEADDPGVQWVCSFAPKKMPYHERKGSDAEDVRRLLLMVSTSYFYEHREGLMRVDSHRWPDWSFGAGARSWASQMRDFALSPRGA